MLGCAEPSKILKIASVHRDDVIEVLEIVWFNATRTLVTEVYTAFAGGGPGS